MMTFTYVQTSMQKDRLDEKLKKIVRMVTMKFYSTNYHIIVKVNYLCTVIYFILQDGLVYAVEFSHRSGRDLLNVAKKRTNIIPIIEDARHPHKYRMLVGKIDYL